MLGYAYQKGRCRSRPPRIEEAIGLNGEAVAMNSEAFVWGRRAAAEPERVDDAGRASRGADAGAAPVRDARRGGRPPRRIPDRLPERAPTPSATAIGSSACGPPRRARSPDATALTDAVARNLFKLMAYKDEYEVARLYTDGQLRQAGRSAQLRGRQPAYRVPPRAAAPRPRATRRRACRRRRASGRGC